MKTLTNILLAAFFLCATAIAQESQKVAPSVPKSHTLTTNSIVLPNGIHIDNRTMSEDMTDASWIPKSMGVHQGYGVTGAVDGNVYHHFFSTSVSATSVMTLRLTRSPAQTEFG